MVLAAWPDGSRAFLDPRGLLHLQSSDASIPEVTIGLAESTSLPVWASDGSIYGPSYFIGDDEALPAALARITNSVQRFIARIRC